MAWRCNPTFLKNLGMSQDDVDLWELNEAFASQCLYCRDARHRQRALQRARRKYRIYHPFGMTGARQTGSILREPAPRQWPRCGTVVGGGQAAAGLFESVWARGLAQRRGA